MGDRDRDDYRIDPCEAIDHNKAERGQKKWPCQNCLYTELWDRGMPEHSTDRCPCRCSGCFGERRFHADVRQFGGGRCRLPLLLQADLPDDCKIQRGRTVDARRVLVTWWAIVEKARLELDECLRAEMLDIGMASLMKVSKIMLDNPFEPEGKLYREQMTTYRSEDGERLVTFSRQYLDSDECDESLHQFMREGQIMEVLVGPKENSLDQRRRRWQQMTIVGVKDNYIYAQIRIQPSNQVFNQREGFQVRPCHFVDTDYKIAMAIKRISDSLRPRRPGVQRKPEVQLFNSEIQNVFGWRRHLAARDPDDAMHDFMNKLEFRQKRDRCAVILRLILDVQVPPTEKQLDAIAAAQIDGLRLVHGPGGCGKTLVLAYAIACKLFIDRDCKIGVFCKSNSACDDVVRVYNGIWEHAMQHHSKGDNEDFGHGIGVIRFAMAIRIRARAERTRIKFMDDGVEKEALMRYDYNKMIIDHPALKTYTMTVEEEAKMKALTDKVEEHGFKSLHWSERKFLRDQQHKWSVNIQKFCVHVSTLGNVEARIFQSTYYNHQFFDEASLIRADEVYPCIGRSLSTDQTKNTGTKYSHLDKELKMQLKSMIVIGDPMQMSPISFSDDVNMRKQQKTSLYDYMKEKGVLTFALNENFRMLPSISELPQQLFYEKIKLFDSDAVKAKEATTMISRHESAMLNEEGARYREELGYFSSPNQHSIYLGVKRRTAPADLKSYLFNSAEVNVVVRLVLSLLMHGKINGRRITAKQIGVLTFYNCQMYSIRKALQQLKDDGLIDEMPTVINVVMAQGREFDIVLLSTVNTYHNLAKESKFRPTAFVLDEKQLCVAFTRAKYGQFIIGGVLPEHYLDTIEHSPSVRAQPYYSMQLYYGRIKRWYRAVDADC